MSDAPATDDLSLRIARAEALLPDGAPVTQVLAEVDALLPLCPTRSGEASPERARLLLLSATAAVHQDRLVDALDTLARALQALGDDHQAQPEVRSRLLNTMAFACAQLGLGEPAMRCAYTALQLALRAQDTALVAHALERIGIGYDLLGAPVESERFLLEALGTTLQHPSPRAELARLSNLVCFFIRRCDTLRAAGEPEAADQALRRCVRHFARGDTLLPGVQEFVVWHWRLNRGIWLARSGDAVTAEATLRAARERAVQQEWHAIRLHAGMELARLMGADGRIDDAIALLTETVCDMRGSDTFALRTQAHDLLAGFLAAQGRRDEELQHRQAHRRLLAAHEVQQREAADRLHAWEGDVVQALIEADRRRLQDELERLRGLRRPQEPTTGNARLQ